MTPVENPERLHALDAVRGLALMLGIAFHATMAYLPGAQIWPAMDDHRSASLAVVFYVLHIFRMATFFLIAGFFAHLMFHRRGARAFVRDRLTRIGLPLVVGWPILFAALAATALWALAQANGGALPKGPAPPAPPLAFPLTHLWFLYVLLLLYAAALAIHALVTRLDRHGRLASLGDGAMRWLMASPFAALILGAPLAAAFWLQPGWLMWFGIASPDHSLIPNLPAVVGFGTAFGFGWLLHRQPGLLRVWAGRWPLNLAAAVALTAAGLAWLGVTPVVTPAPRDGQTLVYALGYAVALWSWTFAVIGLALRFLSGHSLARRYLADASYWLYLVHLPLVMALHTAFAPLPWPAEAKFAAVLAIALPLMLASYELLVRHSVIGAVLNGRRYPRRLPNPAQASTPKPAS